MKSVRQICVEAQLACIENLQKYLVFAFIQLFYEFIEFHIISGVNFVEAIIVSAKQIDKAFNALHAWLK